MISLNNVFHHYGTRPVLRGMLLTGSGGQSRWLRGPGGDEASGAALHALWWPPTKIASRYLAPYLLGREAAKFLASGPEAASPVERDLEYLASPRQAEGRR